VRSNEGIFLLVGDNPFHGISHLSQERARMRGNESTSPENAARLVLKSIENGADGFMFSVSDLTLAILRAIRQEGKADRLELHAIVPYAFEYVRLAAQTGMPGLVKRFAKQIAISVDFGSIAAGLKAAMTADPAALLRIYLSYEISRIKSAAKQANLVSVLLHEVVTDMSLALNLRWLFESYVDFMLKRVRRFEEWDIDLGQTLIVTPFNKVGFQMNPSRVDCERVLKSVSELNVVAISILASGYLRPREAIDYIATLPRIKGVSVGVSKEKHALEIFELLKQKLAHSQQSSK
jgi:hypothetical protein